VKYLFCLVVAATALCGCNRQSHNDISHSVETHPELPSIPFQHAVGFEDGYLLRVPREGQLIWNGSPEDSATISNWIEQYAQAKGAGRLWIEFEPDVSNQRKQWVRRQVVESGLCAQHRCTETDWNAKWSVLN